MRSLRNLYHCLVANICLWWESWILNTSRTTYFSIQAAEVVSERPIIRHRFKPAMTYVRYYIGGRYWTPVLIKVNPRDLSIRRPRKLGRRWGR